MARSATTSRHGSRRSRWRCSSWPPPWPSRSAATSSASSWPACSARPSPACSSASGHSPSTPSARPRFPRPCSASCARICCRCRSSRCSTPWCGIDPKCCSCVSTPRPSRSRSTASPSDWRAGRWCCPRSWSAPYCRPWPRCTAGAIRRSSGTSIGRRSAASRSSERRWPPSSPRWRRASSRCCTARRIDRSRCSWRRC